MNRISHWIALVAAALAVQLAVPGFAGEKAAEAPAEEVAPAEEAAAPDEPAPTEEEASADEALPAEEAAPPEETAAPADAPTPAEEEVSANEAPPAEEAAPAEDVVPAEEETSDEESTPANETVAADDTGTDRKAVQPALWKIADEDTTIYLFGTIHALPSRIEWFAGEVAAAFAASDELVTEIVPEEPAKMQALVFGKAMLPAGETLRGLLSPEEKAEYEAALSAFGLPVQAFDRFEPWYAAVGLSTVPMMRDGFSAANGVEDTLSSRAKALGQSHGALETAEYQLDLFDTLPIEVQKRYLGQVVEDLPTMKDDLRKMVEAWQQGDAEELARLMNAQEDDPALVEALLTGRNRNWAKWIGKRLDEPGTVFLAVGAGHLAGEGSVQDQLTDNGIAAERVQ